MRRVWVVLYIGDQQSESVFSVDVPLSRADADTVRKAVMTECSIELAHCMAKSLRVYLPGTTIPSPAALLSPASTVPETAEDSPLVVMAPERDDGK